jgi:hypothetical protein
MQGGMECRKRKKGVGAERQMMMVHTASKELCQ